MSARISYLVGRLDRLLRKSLADVLAQESLTLPEYTTLSVLRNRAELSNAQLARRSLITPQAMNEVLARLESRRLVDRHAKATQGRARPAVLTLRGERVLARADDAVAGVERAMLAGVPADERRELRRLLTAALQNLQQMS